MKTRVYITVDVEGAEERILRGVLQPPQGYDIRMWCRFSNQVEELGVGLIMRELEKFDQRGTFFVEVFGSHYFGNESLAAVCKSIHSRGHDVQLHTHPIQRIADFRSRGQKPAPDNIADYDVKTQADLLREGVDILAKCGIPREELLAFRAGNFGANNETWAAMREVGLRLSSNFNPCYFQKNCKMRWRYNEPGLFEVEPGIWELPISNFEEANGFRHIQITAVSLEEMKDYLRQARQIGIGEVTIVTHSFEFCHIDSVREKKGRPNTVNIARLRGLCSFLAEHSSEFEVDTVGALARRLPIERAWSPLPIPQGSRRFKVRRLAEQAFKRLEASAGRFM